jgi:hypothetical protein
MGGIIVISGSLPPSTLIDPTTRTHYYPNTTCTLSIQDFTPISMQPNTVLVRCNCAQATGTGLTCRVFDSSGNQVLVDNPSTNVDGISNFTNIVFPIEGSTAKFPAFGLWTVELDFVHINLVGIELVYKPVFPMLLDNTLSSSTCSTTVVIS